jgi:hypothetical protein
MPVQLPAQPKLYCYVDETGQDTLGELFIVAVVVSGADRDSLVAKLEEVERTSGKGRVKWMSSRHHARFAYIQAVLSSPLFRNKTEVPTLDYCPEQL